MAEILGQAVKSSKVYYEVPISYSGRTFVEGKKIKGRHAIGVILMIIKNGMVVLIDEQYRDLLGSDVREFEAIPNKTTTAKKLVRFKFEELHENLLKYHPKLMLPDT